MYEHCLVSVFATDLILEGKNGEIACFFFFWGGGGAIIKKNILSKVKFFPVFLGDI